jgi:hypothetical protein
MEAFPNWKPRFTPVYPKGSVEQDYIIEKLCFHCSMPTLNQIAPTGSQFIVSCHTAVGGGMGSMGGPVLPKFHQTKARGRRIVPVDPLPPRGKNECCI